MTDAGWMQRALALAEQGVTVPNPMVGCVLVKNGRVVGEGFHPRVGEPHAEVFALRSAGGAARGAVAYVTLEPCSHWGRTPPCADALIAAGVERVVVAMQDPNPVVGGKGLQRLRDAGIRVDVGVLESEARALNEAFIHFHTTKTPFVILKAAMTLDGKIAAAGGDSRWVTSSVARDEAHRLRSRVSAVLVGIGTVLADDPLLTARLDPPAPRQPLRIVADSRLQMPPDAALIRSAREAPQTHPVLIACVEGADPGRRAALGGDGVEVMPLPPDSRGRVDFAELMRRLADRQIISVLVDGGGELHASLVASGIASKVLFYVAPKIVGGRQAPTPVAGDGRDRMDDAWPLERMTARSVGPDLALEAYFVR